ncbi:hypothetical protein MASR1M31_18560 [Porphyromonadaceae bacterium]
MNKLFSLLLILGLFSYGCGKNENNTAPYLAEIATVSKKVGETVFIQDRTATVLRPVKSIPAISALSEGERVLIYYVPMDGSATEIPIEILNVGRILTKSVRELPSDSMALLPDFPLKVESAWLSGEYVNLHLLFNYFENPHSLNMFLDSSRDSSDTLLLRLFHNTNSDPAGVEVRSYASFSIASVLSKYHSSHIVLRINSSNYGMKDFLLK